MLITSTTTTMTILRPLALACAIAVAPSIANAQLIDLAPNGPSQGDLAAYAALISTPSGAFAPLFTSTMAGIATTAPRFALRYGHIDESGVSVHDLGATVVIPASTNATLQLSGGVAHPSCNGCDNQLMLSLGGDMNLYSAPLGSRPSDGRVTVGLSGELGYGKVNDVSFVSGTVGLPFALPIGSGPLKFAPYVVPAFGVGRTGANGTSDNGSRFMLGGGVGLFNPESSVSLSAGFQNIFINGGNMVFGIALSFGS